MALLKASFSAWAKSSPARRSIAWLSGALLFFATAVSAATPTEYQLKAAFLFNFAQFVEWPASAFRTAQSPLIIGVLGDDPFGPYLDELVNGEKVGERPLVPRRFKRVEDIGECHILFISRSESSNLERILGRLRERSVLTVSDIEGFSRQGGMVRFVTENGKIRLRINVEAAKSCNLTISSKILRPGTIVTSGGN